ncbi:MAG: uracil-DNA glycosylase [Firmicutes bacterium HGW-Firmicutes-7]|nr:MAG: uracil-DNA glycosylase [Firmicutes bacterium HGW-Firmicutes-7]
MENREITNCIGCNYYYITWDKTFPKGCKYFGFKSNKMPCIVVKESAGGWCNVYTPKKLK